MTLVLSSIVPAIAGTGAVMATFQAKYRTIMLSFVAEGGSLAEEAISSVRTSHAFGTQKKLTGLYDVSNQKAQYYGKKTAYLTAAGLCLFFFIIYSAYALAFWWGATVCLYPF
jgi:ATP-binding cassette subfamily B (MDR/TAP) protein 1